MGGPTFIRECSKCAHGVFLVVVAEDVSCQDPADTQLIELGNTY